MKYNSIGEQLIAKAKELDPSYTPDKFNDMSEALDVILNKTGSGSSSTQLYLDIMPYITQTTETNGTITQEGFNVIQTKLNNGEIIGIIFNYAYFNIYSVDPSEPLKTRITFLHNAENEIYLKLTINEETLTWSAEPESISSDSSSGGEMIDLNEQIDFDKYTITQSGYNLIQQAYENNTLLGISFILNGLPIKCMFDYVDINLVTHTNVYCFKFGVGETYVIKIKSDLTIIPSPQNSFGDISSFEQVGYDGTFVNSFVSDNKTYKIPYTLIYPHQDTYKNERLQFMNDTYSETTYKIPDLPSDASTKAYTLQTVNGVLTWTREESIVNNLTLPQTAPSSQVIPSITTSNEQQNLTIGDGLEVKDGALISTLSNFKYGTLCLNNITNGDETLNIELSFFDDIYDSIINGANLLLGTSLTRDTFPQYIQQNKSIDLIISLIDNTLTLIKGAYMMPYFNITVCNDTLGTYYYNCPIKKDGSSISLFLGSQEMILNTSLTFDNTFTVVYHMSWYGD